MSYYLVIAVAKEKKRKGLFSVIDQKENRPRVLKRSMAKRIITTDLFDKIQRKVDSYPDARVTLIEAVEDDPGKFETLIKGAKPQSDEYLEILRTIRYQ